MIQPLTLIIPPSSFLADERVFPFIGILKVAASARAAGHPVDVLDLSGFANIEDVVTEYLRERPDVRYFGLTATTPQLPTAVRVARVIRAQVPAAILILGGPHATMTHSAKVLDCTAGRYRRGSQAWKQLVGLFDIVVTGDGERAILRVLEHGGEGVLNAGDPKSGLWLARGTLDEQPPPARDLIDLDSYHYTIDGRRSFSAIAMLGCPFGCKFCSGREAASYRIARVRDPVAVAAEIEQVVRDGWTRGVHYEGVMFYDDELNSVKGNLEALCHELIALQERLGTEMRFRGFVKAELFTPEQARIMYQAGWRVLLSGVESGSDFILGVMQKHTTAAINTRCLHYAHEAGLKFKALMSLGHAGETPATVDESLNWVLRERPDDVDWTIITQYPGSPYYDHSELEQGAWLYVDPGTKARLWSASSDFVHDTWFYKGMPGDYTSYVWTDALSAEDLVRERDRAERVTRSALGLPDIQSVAARQFEHSMGQGLPASILRSSVAMKAGIA